MESDVNLPFCPFAIRRESFRTNLSKVAGNWPVLDAYVVQQSWVNPACALLQNTFTAHVGGSLWCSLAKRAVNHGHSYHVASLRGEPTLARARPKTPPGRTVQVHMLHSH